MSFSTMIYGDEADFAAIKALLSLEMVPADFRMQFFTDERDGRGVIDIWATNDSPRAAQTMLFLHGFRRGWESAKHSSKRQCTEGKEHEST